MAAGGKVDLDLPAGQHKAAGGRRHRDAVLLIKTLDAVHVVDDGGFGHVKALHHSGNADAPAGEQPVEDFQRPLLGCEDDAFQLPVERRFQRPAGGVVAAEEENAVFHLDGHRELFPRDKLGNLRDVVINDPLRDGINIRKIVDFRPRRTG